jgi:hypothetical protein
MAPTNSPTDASLISSDDLSGLLASLGSPGRDEDLDDVGSILAEEIDVVPFFLGEPLQHERGRVHPARGTTDSTLEPPEGLIAERADNRGDPIVAARAPPFLHTQFGERQIDVVMDDQHPIEGNAEVANQRGHRLARFVHKGERSRQDGAVSIEVQFSNLGADPRRLLEPRLMAPGKSRDNVAAQVVPGVLVALARVAQPDNECR